MSKFSLRLKDKCLILIIPFNQFTPDDVINNINAHFISLIDDVLNLREVFINESGL